MLFEFHLSGLDTKHRKYVLLSFFGLRKSDPILLVGFWKGGSTHGCSSGTRLLCARTPTTRTKHQSPPLRTGHPTPLHPPPSRPPPPCLTRSFFVLLRVLTTSLPSSSPSLPSFPVLIFETKKKNDDDDDDDHAEPPLRRARVPQAAEVR